jgi:multidrug efflux system membrane fusion protein
MTERLDDETGVTEEARDGAVPPRAELPPEVLPKEPATRPAPARRKRGRAQLAALFALLAAAGVFLGRHYLAKPEPGTRPVVASHAPPPPPVQAGMVRVGDFPVELVELGTVTPVYTMTVFSQIAGYLIDVEFKEGDYVKPGQELALVDPRPYEVQLEQYEAQLEQDQATLAEARMDLERYRTLNRQDSIARQTYEDQVYLVKQYEGKVKVDQANIDSARLNLIYCHITAPFEGRIGLRLVDPGNFVSPSSSTGIAVLTTMHPITVIFTLPEDDLPDVNAELKKHGALKVAAFDRADRRHLADGTLYAVDAEINTTTGMVNLRATFDNKDDALFPNQFVNAHLLVRTLHGVVIAPRAAILEGQQGYYTYVIGPDGKAEVRPVELGPQNRDEVVITKGLAGGEQVVTDGADRLRDGMTVRIIHPGAGDHAEAAPRARGAAGQGASGKPTVPPAPSPAAH